MVAEAKPLLVAAEDEEHKRERADQHEQTDRRDDHMHMATSRPPIAPAPEISGAR